MTEPTASEQRRAARPEERRRAGMTGVTLDQIRRLALSLPRTTEHLVYGRVKFRIKQIVYIAMSADETTMGCGFPKEERAAMLAAEPEKFFSPRPSELRFQWIEVNLAAIDVDEMVELVVDAWRLCVPKKVFREHLGDPPDLRRAIDAMHRRFPGPELEDMPRPVDPRRQPGDPPAAERAEEPAQAAPRRRRAGATPTRRGDAAVRAPGTPRAGRPGRSRSP